MTLSFPSDVARSPSFPSAPGSRVALRQVEDSDPERLRYLKSLGLVPTVEVEVTDRQPFGGPLTVRIGGKDSVERVIGVELASCLLVERR